VHEIRDSESEPLRMLNFYVPPAHRKEGETSPRGNR